MKPSVLIVLAGIVTLAGCMHTSPTKPNSSRILEEAVLWKAKIDHTWVSIELRELMKDNDSFQRDGNFYKVKGHHAFGCPVKYVCLMGFGDLQGPNVVLVGSPKEIVTTITRDYRLKLDLQKDGSYSCKLKDKFILAVCEYPGKKNQTVVIGAYFGL